MNGHKSCWDILEISPTKNKKIIKRAYAKKATIFHPEDFPEEFKQLQTAYKSALSYASSTANEYHQTGNTYISSSINKNKNETKDTKDKTINQAKDLESIDEQIRHIEIPKDLNSINLEIPINNIDSNIIKHQTIIHYNNQLIKIRIEGPIIQTNPQENNKVINLSKKSILNQLKELSAHKPKKQDFISFFQQSDVQLFLDDTYFKDSIDSILCSNYRKYDANCIHYLKSISNQYQFNNFNKATTKKNKKLTWSLLWSLGLLVFIIIFHFNINLAKKTTTHNNKYNNITTYNNTDWSDNNNKTDNATNMLLNKSYLNGITVEYQDFQYYIKDQNNTNLIDETISDVTYTYSSLLLLKIDNNYYIFDTYDCSLSNQGYKTASVYNCITNDSTTKKKIVISIDDALYVYENNTTPPQEITVQESSSTNLYLEEGIYIIK